MPLPIAVALLVLTAPVAPQHDQTFAGWPQNKHWPSDPMEKHLRNIRQLTFGGQNAEAYWSKDGKWITWQSKQSGFPDEQIFVMRADGSGKTLMSTGLGRCTCSYFSPDKSWIYFSSTHERNKGPQAPVDMSQGYVWRVNPDFALYRQKLGPVPNSKARMMPMPVVKKPGYVAETTIDPKGRFMTFTGDWEGDIDIYRSDLEGGHLKRLTTTKGYDGGPFVSWDGKYIVYRRGAFANKEEEQKFDELHAKHLVMPLKMDLWIMDSDGKHKRQLTHLAGASFAPFMLPGDKRIIFSSNYENPTGPDFDLYMINVDGTNMKRITYAPGFDSFPMFTRDGKHLVWASNRHGSVPHETNVFVADWAD